MVDLKACLQRLQQNLNILEERQAKYAGNEPVELLNQIDDHVAAITLTELAIAGHLSEADWREALRPLLVDIHERSQVDEAFSVTIGDVFGDLVGNIIAGRDITAGGDIVTGVKQSAGDYSALATQGGTAVVNIYQQTRPAQIAPDELAEARQRLAALPLEEIPAPASLPAGSRMPFKRNRLFVGREPDLKELAQTLKGGQTAAIGQIAAATGLGGIGKTQLASEFVHRYGQFFAGGVFWLSFADSAAIQAEIALCGGRDKLNLAPDYDALELETQVRLVLSAWQSELPRLLVFDNCEEEELLKQWRPPTGDCRLLVTSRRGSWSATMGVQVLALGVLSRAESVALLRGYRPDITADDPELAAIAEELGDLPLALHLAGSFLKRYQHTVTPAGYRAQLQDKTLLNHPSLTGWGVTDSPTGHELHVGRTFALSYDRLLATDEIDQMALVLLGRAACFTAGEPIPRELLLATVEGIQDEPDGELLVEDALLRLVDLGLLEREAEGTLLLHRLVAAFVRQVVPDPEARTVVEAALLAEAIRLNNAGYPMPLLAWQPHLRTVTDIAQQRGDERGAALCSTLGYHLQMIGDYEAARPYLERALTICEAELGPNHPDTAGCLNNLAALLQDQGDYETAQPYYERALAICEAVRGAKHPDTARCMNNFGLLLQVQGDYEAAQSYLEQALAIREEVLGLNHPDMAQSLNNLGMLHKVQGDYEAARPYLERTLAIVEEVLGPKHPDTASSLNNLALLLQAQGDYEAARPYLERALAIREEVLGLNHPTTTQSLNNLANLFQVHGDYEAARPYLERALAVREEALGPNHPATATNLNNLGMLFQAQGDYEVARPYLERALAIREEILGPKHPATAQSLNNLGMLHYAQGDYEAARPYLEQALAIREEILGPKHPATAQSLNNLGMLHYAQGDYEAARPYLEQALAIREEILGSKHPDMASSLNNLAGLLQAQGDYEAAWLYLERALAIVEEVLGPKHPATAQSLNNLANLVQAQGDYEAARPYLERALIIREETLGLQHPDMAQSLNNLGMLHYAQGDYETARPYLEQALAIYEAVLGSTHPQTQTVADNLEVFDDEEDER